METKELKITIPEKHEIDWRESAKQEKIVFKRKEINRPKNWKEYCDNFKGQFYYIRDDRDTIGTSFTSTGLISAYKNILPTKELADASLAMMQLMSLREDWIHKWLKDIGITDDWKPNWDGTFHYFCIIILDNKYVVDKFHRYRQPLSFPSREMAEDFMDCFRDLLEIAKPLL